jgi:hypothetical protein
MVASSPVKVVSEFEELSDHIIERGSHLTAQLTAKSTIPIQYRITDAKTRQVTRL